MTITGQQIEGLVETLKGFVNRATAAVEARSKVPEDQMESLVKRVKPDFVHAVALSTELSTLLQEASKQPLQPELMAKLLGFVPVVTDLHVKAMKLNREFFGNEVN